MILVFAAMSAEVRACGRDVESMAKTRVAGFSAFEDEDLLVVQTGLGRRAAGAAEAALATWTPEAVLSVGVAGGLRADIERGEVVVCRRIDHESHRTLKIDATVRCDDGLIRQALEVAGELGLSAREGASVTVDEVAWTLDEKAAHHAWKGHDIVEMESFWVGEAAARSGIPFLALRTISDGATDELVRTQAIKDDGSFDQGAVVAYLGQHPEAGPLLVQQGERARLALRNLNSLMSVLVVRLAREQG